ncbi:MAG TPA: hypothetical protein VER58_18865 [Thermoanaerobaculia bacterium]|nr:hypothetical protein [Thermoanaerobaculia bacterium]
MFIGHNAVAFAAKRVAPKTSLGTLTGAAMLLDLLWPIFLLLGIEHVRIATGATKFTPLDLYDYPWTHSLAMSMAWAVGYGVAYWIVTRSGRGAMVVALCVVSHWLLDFIVHRPDLPLWPGGPKFGLGLWNYPRATMAIEFTMYLIAIMIYRDTTRARDKAGSIGFWTFVIVLFGIYLSVAIGPPPPNTRVIAIMGLTGWLLPLWAWWFDRHREATV